VTPSDIIETFTKTCVALAAQALNIDASRVSATGRDTEEGVEITILIDGAEPTASQQTAIDTYMNKIVNAAKN
jgi:hypothetical protein